MHLYCQNILCIKTLAFKKKFTYKTCHILWKLKLKKYPLIIERIWEK